MFGLSMIFYPKEREKTVKEKVQPFWERTSHSKKSTQVGGIESMTFDKSLFKMYEHNFTY